MTSVFETARQLAERFDDRWRADRNDPDGFGAAAAEVLEQTDVCDDYRLDRVTESILNLGALPQQQSVGNFGQPPITLHTDPENRFFIELYLWSSLDMGIHNHAFVGAFSALTGSCINQTFAFRSTDAEAARLRTGELTVAIFDRMAAGGVREIRRDLIHRNLHLDRPTSTLVLRTFRSPGPQYVYYEPGLAFDGALSPETYKQLQWLEGLMRIEASPGWTFLERVIGAQTDPAHSLRMIELALRKSGSWERLPELLDLAPALAPHREAVAAALAQVAEGEPSLEDLLSQADPATLGAK